MTGRLPFLLPLTAALSCAGALAAAPGGMRPGLWETTVTSNMSGGKPVSTRACISAKQLEDPKGMVPKMEETGMKCEQLDTRVSGNTVHWKMRCTGEAPMEGSGQMTSGTDSYNGKMEMTVKMQGQTMTMSQTMSGRRVGDCPSR
ncbi:MAG: DUF3617 family protein [Burkholderiales bacterium]|nr:DUF3617 family protein [Burkholderiales bacterium]